MLVHKHLLNGSWVVIRLSDRELMTFTERVPLLLLLFLRILHSDSTVLDDVLRIADSRRRLAHINALLLAIEQFPRMLRRLRVSLR